MMAANAQGLPRESRVSLGRVLAMEILPSRAKALSEDCHRFILFSTGTKVAGQFQPFLNGSLFHDTPRVPKFLFCDNGSEITS
jgi:hypothetical protein